MPHRVAVLIAGFTLALFASAGAAQAAPLANTVHLDFLGDAVAPPAAGGPHDLPAGTGAAGRRAVDLCRPPGRRRLQEGRRRCVRRGDQHLRTGRLQRRRPRAGGRRLRAPLAADGRRREPATRLCAAARTHLPADRVRAERRERRALDAARRDTASERRSARGARPLRQRRVVLARPQRCGRSARATGRSVWTTRPSRPSCAPGSNSPSARSTARCSTPTRSTQVVDGRRVPAWLIVDGADATAEAMLGLTAYVDAGGSPAARRALARFARASPRSAARAVRRRAALAVRRGPAVRAVALDLARLGVADARRARGRGRRAGPPRPARSGARRRRLVHAAPARRGRAGERLDADAE